MATEEEKKALIIRMQRAMMAGLCSQAGTQDPVFFLHRNDDGTGSLTAIWESEAAAFETLLQALENAKAAATMKHEQRKRLVIEGVEKSHGNLPGVSYTFVPVAGGPPGAVKALLTYPAYDQFLDKMYADAVRMQQEQLLAQRFQQTEQSSHQGVMSSHQGVMHGHAAIGQTIEAQNLAMQQIHGIAPTHYINGVPNYNDTSY